MRVMKIGIMVYSIFVSGYTIRAEAKTDTLKLSIAEAQSYALENNRTVRTSKIDVEIAKKKVWETTAIGLPQFTATADYQHIFKVPEMSFGAITYLQANPSIGDGTPITAGDIRNQSVSLGYQALDPVKLGVADNTTFNFTLTQLIFSGEYLVGLQASKVYKEFSEKNLIKTNQSIIESVTSGYYLVIVLNENINVLKKSLVTVETVLNEITKMTEQGFAEQTDADQFKINRSNIKNLINSISNQREVALKLLKLQTGIEFSQTILLTDSISTAINKANTQYAVANYNVENSIDYSLMNTQEQSMELLLKRQQSTFLPSVAGFYRHQQFMEEPALNFQPKDVVGVSITLPIFTSGQRISRVGQAKLDLKKAQITKENVRENLVMGYEQAKNEYITAQNTFANNKESMELSERIYNKNMIKYKEGVISSMELTQSQGQFLNTQSSYFNSLLTMLSAQAKLDRILSK